MKIWWAANLVIVALCAGLGSAAPNSFLGENNEFLIKNLLFCNARRDGN